jgi:hypothetical protein
LFLALRDQKKENCGEDDDDNYRHWLFFMIFSDSVVSGLDLWKTAKKKDLLFYRQLHFQGLRALQRGRDLEGLMWKGLRGLPKFFFPISDVASF